ncbi:MAG TPA: hypothetical protein VMW83_06165 [Spirochaetia bacterium]|nr:hypothetical protein [Spirochaetia bacterium]
MPTMVTLKTGLFLSPEEGDKLKSRLTRFKGVNRVDVLYPDRLLITYDSPRVTLSTLKAAVNAKEPKSISVNRK